MGGAAAGGGQAGAGRQDTGTGRHFGMAPPNATRLRTRQESREPARIIKWLEKSKMIKYARWL